MDPNLETIVSVTILTMVMTISLIGNLLTVISTIQTCKLRSFTNILICNLAFSDLLITCINLPIRICQYFGLDWATGGASQCKISVTLTIVMFTSSNSNLFLITLDRFLGITYPLRYRSSMTRRKINIAIALSWTYSFIVGIFPFAIVGDKIVSEDDRVVVCTFSTVLSPAYVIFIEFGTFFTPWFIMFAMYIVILQKLYVSRNSRLRSETQLTEMNGGSTRSRKESRGTTVMRTITREFKLAKGVCIVLAMYTLLLMPIATIDVIDTISQAPVVPLMTIKIALILAYTNPAVNPPIYALTSSKYRKAFARLLCCKSNLKSFKPKDKRNSLNRGSNVARRSAKVQDIGLKIGFNCQ